MEDEGDVYDLVEEDQYAKIVEGRRSGNDFVVDDSKSYAVTKLSLFITDYWWPAKFDNFFNVDGMGYYDDGEEHVGVAEDSFDG